MSKQAIETQKEAKPRRYPTLEKVFEARGVKIE